MVVEERDTDVDIVPVDLRSAVDLRPYGDEHSSWWVASDLGEDAHVGPLPLDHVLGIGGASTTLASWTPRTRVARALDVGMKVERKPE